MSGPLDRRPGVAALLVQLPPGPAAQTAVPYLPAEQAESLMNELTIDSSRALANGARL